MLTTLIIIALVWVFFPVIVFAGASVLAIILSPLYPLCGIAQSLSSNGNESKQDSPLTMPIEEWREYRKSLEEEEQRREDRRNRVI